MRKPRPTFRAWLAEGVRLANRHDGMQWKIGDWWNAGEKWKRRSKTFLASDQWPGPEPSTCYTCGWVASRFPISRRREVLTWGHHREAAPLVPETADRLLDWCEEPLTKGGRRRSIQELRRLVYIARASEVARKGLPLLAAAPMRPRKTYSEWGELPARQGNPSMQAALDALGAALDRCLLQGVSPVDVRYMIWVRFGRLTEAYYSSRLARRRLLQGLPVLDEAAAHACAAD
jgi:hypothetical protein